MTKYGSIQWIKTAISVNVLCGLEKLAYFPNNTTTVVPAFGPTLFQVSSLPRPNV